ncbi:RagB/SusD family nutrient uptake outer membrane protein [Flavobacterium sp.]|uniref:RagB/SusD family nutrient uptake outer membrane protein n=1 Tax=Flavobacterium sp. TaxID=239 RepID=UPI003D0BC042
MKSTNKLITLILLLVVIVGCSEDFLDRPSQSQISANNFYKTTSDMRLATASLYSAAWGQWNNGAMLNLGDVLSGNGTTGQYQGADQIQLYAHSLSASNSIVRSAWVGMYNVIGQSNNTILGIEQYAPATISEIDKKAAIAEARFIRGVAYFYLAIHWGAVPIVEDNSKLIDNPLIYRAIISDVYKFVTNDLTYAAENLPVMDEKGRVTKWSAQGMLAKVYLTMACLQQTGGSRKQEYLDKAKLYAGSVCKNSGLILHPSYYDLFRVQFNDVPEDLFALQWTAPAEYNLGNILNNLAPSADLMPQKTGAWSSMHPTYEFYLAYTAQDSIRRKATMMLTGDKYPELNAAGGGYKATGTYMKKHIIGNDKDNSSPLMSWSASPEHNAILRLADVYLIYAEAILGNSNSTTDADALLYFNKVRERAGINPVTSLNYVAILNERHIELGYEGQYWMDLVRLSYWNPVKAINLLNAQDRRLFTYDPILKEATPDETTIASVIPATVSSFTLQIPATEMTANPKLAKPPVPYY